ncbi:MAG: A/G-specific adenine glycosylase [Candidatus Eremiobacteraeota bacterium]|nr:A/G-specific adenine glycosylase [Candidatus Eremiobacteraeota bacterium]
MNDLQRSLLAWYARSGRTHLPWRTSRNPYFTLVSEFMLQQTQVDRVIGKFEAFVAAYPTIESLAQARASDVVRLWQGLGYNSRATRLVDLARIVFERFGGAIPRDRDVLRSLPGVGPYTAAAIRAFGFDEDDAAIDTNVRRITHRVIFGIEYPAKAPSKHIDEAALASVPRARAHDWNSAMMDLGSAICTARAPLCLACPIRDACAAGPVDPVRLAALRKQYAKARVSKNAVPFERTKRFARGRIVDRLRELPPGERISLLDLHRVLEPQLPWHSIDDITGLVAVLERDGLLTRFGEAVALKD